MQYMMILTFPDNNKALMDLLANFEGKCRYQHDLTLVNTMGQMEDNPPALVEQAE